MSVVWKAFAIVLALAPAGIAHSQKYPTRPVRIIVGFAPAGTADLTARLVGQKLSDAWGEPVIVDNRPGAGSTIGSEIASRATPDGYTLMVVSASYATSAGLYQKLNFDPINSFAPVALISSGPNVLVVHPSVQAASTRDLIAMAKANPGRITMGSAGTGSITHLSGALFTSMAGIQVVHVPYKGGGPAAIALVGGQINFSILALPTVLGQVKAGRVKAFGVTSLKRSPALPDVPTIAESGVPGYEARNWWGILAPAGAPKPIVVKLNQQIRAILKSPDMVAAVADHGAEPEGGTPEAFGSFLKSEVAKWTKVIRDAGVPRQ